MKKICSVLSLALLSCSVWAQNIYDAVNYFQNEQIGTARSLGMGNAMVAIGGDLGAIALNPAGAAASGFSQVAFTAGSNISLATTQGTTLDGSSTPYSFGNRFRQADARFACPNVGINFNYETGRRFGVKNVTFSLIANASNYSNDKLFASGTHYGTSFAGAMASRAHSIPWTSLDGDKAFDHDWNAAVAWRSGMISTAGECVDEYVGATEKFVEDEDGNRQYFVAGALNQDYGRMIVGNRADYLFNLAINISDVAYLGAAIGVSSMQYSFDEYLKESPVDQDEFDVDFGSAGKTYFKDLKYQNWYKAKGSGAYLKMGFLATPGNFRIGASFQTPSSFTIRETWGCSAETHYLNDKFNGKASSPSGDYYYKFASPWILNLGLASTIAGKAVLSADLESDIYSSMRFRPYYREDDYTSLNGEVKRNAGSSWKVRTGLEVKPLDWLSVRAGYNMSAICMGVGKNADIAKSTSINHAATFGLGFSTKGAFYFDLACKALLRNSEYIYPYADYDVADNGNILHFSPEILNRRQLITAVFTIGYRFF